LWRCDHDQGGSPAPRRSLVRSRRRTRGHLGRTSPAPSKRSPAFTACRPTDSPVQGTMATYTRTWPTSVGSS
jgi:hypothetical protein